MIGGRNCERNYVLLVVFRMWFEGGASDGLSISRPIVRDTQTIHTASNPLCSLRLLAGRYGATGALQLLRDPTGQRPFTAQTRVQIPPGTPNQYLIAGLSTLCFTRCSEILGFREP